MNFNFNPYQQSDLFDAVAELMVVLDLELRIQWANRAAGELVGEDPESLLGRYCYQVWHGRETTCEKCPVQSTIRTGMHHKGEVESPDGKVFLIKSYPLRTPEGELKGITEVSLDITEYRKTADALQQKSRELEERVKELDCLHRLSRLTEQPDISRQELMQSAVELIPFGWQYPDMTRARLLLEGEAFYSRDFQETAWKQSSDIVVNDSNAGRVEVFYLREAPECNEGPFLSQERELIENIAESLGQYLEREQAREALHRSESYYRALFESSGTAMFIIDEDNTIALANSYFEKLSGYTRHELEGRKAWTEFMHPEDVDWMKEYHSLRHRDPGAVPRQLYECRFIDRHGQMQYLFLGMNVIPGTNQSMAFSVDITERKSLEQELREQNNLLDSIINGIPDILAIQYPDHSIERYNQAGYQILNLSPEEVRHKKCFQLIGRDRECEQCATREALRTGKLEQLEKYVPELGIYLDCRSNPVLDEDGNAVRIIEQLRDITERKNAEEALRRSENYYRALFESSGTAMFIINEETTIALVNSHFEELSGYSREEIEGRKSWTEFIHSEDLARMKEYHYLRRRDPDAAPRRYECRFIDRHGQKRDLLLSVNMIPETSQSILAGVDLTERKRAEERVYSLTYFDELTGLPNRSLFLELLGKAVSRSERFHECGAVLLVNIERLKSVNDTLGEQAGNELIREVGRRIWGTLRDRDRVARVSGDEFMILAEGIGSGENARKLGLRILERIEEDLELSHRRIHPEASIGFTLFPHGATDSDSLIKQADMALSGAKKSANGIHQFAGDEEGISREFHLEQDLRSALANEEFRLFYQSQIDLQSGKTVGLEALIRWSHPQRGLVSPGEFIPLLERSGMIASVDAWVVRRVCEQLRSWRDEGFSVRTSVNLSAHDLANDTILGVVSSALEENRLSADALSVELTETDIMENVDQASRILQTLSSWGIRVALDDFGKGYSSLSYLQKLPINIIKIDKQFVDGLPENQDSVTLVQTIIAMAHNMGKEVLAEGVETEEQRRILYELGCDYGQGFLWSRPKPAEEAIR